MWCGVVWCGVVWCGVVWCGVVCVCVARVLTEVWYGGGALVNATLRLALFGGCP